MREKNQMTRGGGFLRRWLLAPWLIGVLSISSCAKISSFSEPYMVEVALGSLSIIPALRGLSPGARATGAVTIVGNETGETVSIYGLPKNEPFELIPKVALENEESIGPQISGFEARVVDKNTIEVISTAKEDTYQPIELHISGTIVRSGPLLATLDDEPIVISGRAGDIKNMVKQALQVLVIRISDGERLENIDDNEMIPMYQIRFKGPINSVL